MAEQGVGAQVRAIRSDKTWARGAAEATQWVHSFDSRDGGGRVLLGGKGAELAEMTSLGLPVPPGFTITTEACLEYYRNGQAPPEDLWDQVDEELRGLEAATGRKFGDPANPLLLSVRSGAAVSMPGMMDTILNLGINQAVVGGIASRLDDEHFALDLYRRFIQMYANVVMSAQGSLFEETLEDLRRQAGVGSVAGLSAGEMRVAIERFKRIVVDAVGANVPEEPVTQLRHAIEAVFSSWNTRRAIDYRNFHGIPHDLGTAVNVQAMVFGNMDDDSSTGVLFTRDPSTGEKTLYGEYLVNAQGEDLVAGIATPRNIERMAVDNPGMHRQLVETCEALERHYRDAQDVEFTVERGKLYVLQTRAAKRSARAAVKMAVEMAEEGLVTRDEALLRVEPAQISQLLFPRIDAEAKEQAQRDGRLLGTGLGASPGGVTGIAAFTADAAVNLESKGLAVILVRPETTADDIHGMIAAVGLLTSRGGATSHAAVVARGIGKPCVTGAESVNVSPEEGCFECGGVTVKAGEEISIDGATGEIFVGALETIQPQVSEEHDMVTLLGWADDAKRLGVRANADYPRDAKVALEYGAEGIGLCRTEHMFFEPSRLALVRETVLGAYFSLRRPDDSAVADAYRAALAKLEEFQTDDFEQIFLQMDGKPVVIRLLDPPMHEFLPGHAELAAELAATRSPGDASAIGKMEEVHAAIADMRESNPMLGLRGCRLGLVYPDIYLMQVRAMMSATQRAVSQGVDVDLEIMAPLVSHANELKRLREILEQSIEQFQESAGARIGYEIGAMIEAPRAALTADEIAEFAEFFSCGTNDLTQTTFAMSRDDAEAKFLLRYVEEGILPENPFQVVDRAGVGQLVRIACDLGRKARPGMTIGVCGEHGGDEVPSRGV